MFDVAFDPTSSMLQTSMALRQRRQALIASNIANVETPNYRAVDIDFRATMLSLLGKSEAPTQADPPALVMRRSNPWHFSNEITPVDPVELERHLVFAAGDSPTFGNDSNSSSLELQIARLEMNNLQYAAAAKLLGKRLTGIKNIIESTSRS